MANSKVEILFTALPEENDVLHIGENTLGLDIMEVFRAVRSGMFQTKLPAPFTSIDPETEETTTIYSPTLPKNYRDAFNLDYNGTGLFTVSIISHVEDGLGKVTIMANYPNAIFVDNNTLDSVELTITNEAGVDQININNVSFSQAASNPCVNVDVNVLTDILATKIISPISVDPNTDNPFTITVLRGQTIDVTVENYAGSQFTQTIVTPSILSASNFTLNINNTPAGATLDVSNANTTGLNLEYSLDNINWQTSNVFSGLAADNYTLYVRDQLGCYFTIDFTVTSSGVYIPFFYISKSDSIRWAQRIIWGDAANYKNDENTLSCEVDVPIPYHEVQLFQTADVVTTQFKSNYATNVVNVIRENGSIVSVPVTKKTNNIAIKAMLDARQYNLGNGFTGIYFLAGNTYDYTTLASNGSHALNGTLPEWGVVGNYINISGSWFVIENTLFDETKNADVLVITQTYTGPEINIIVGSIYNYFEYEVYEFSIDMVDYIDENIRVKILNSDPNFQTLEHVSEQISVAVRHEFTLDIEYWNNTNNDVFYATGIKHRIRIPYTKIEGLTDEESAIHKTDANSILLNAEMYEGDRFIFEPMTKELWRKVMMALSHYFVFIDGVQYVKNGDFDSDGPLEESNLYVLKANMLKTGTVYNSDGSTFTIGNSGQVQIPGLLSGDNGFIAY